MVWGNEHECQPQLTESLVGTYRILQPGSSIASSYSSTESSLCPKHMAFFEIKEKKFRMRAIRYKQVRQFLYKDICLRDLPHLDPNHAKIEELIRDVLVTKINEMILEGRAGIEDATPPGADLLPVKFKLRDPQKILVRLRVDHEGFPALNQQRFGAHFVGEVANPADVLLFAKKRKEMSFRATEGQLSNRAHSAQEDLKKILAEGMDDEINKIKIEDLVNETLAASNHTLNLLAEAEMAQVRCFFPSSFCNNTCDALRSIVFCISPKIVEKTYPLTVLFSGFGRLHHQETAERDHRPGQRQPEPHAESTEFGQRCR